MDKQWCNRYYLTVFPGVNGNKWHHSVNNQSATEIDVPLPHDAASVLYFLMNIPEVTDQNWYEICII